MGKEDNTMDENTQVMTPDEATTPQEPVTTPADPAPAEPTAEAPAEGQPEDTTPPAEPAADAEATPTPVMVPAKYKHEELSFSIEEATPLVQLGLKRRDEQPMLDKLALLAAGRGKSVQEYVESLVQYDEEVLRDEKLQITHGNAEEAEKLVQLDLDARRTAREERDRQEQAAEQQAQQTLTERLAAEFVELQHEFPELTEFSTVPPAVKNDAARNGRHLVDAYLRYKWQEGKKIEQNRAAQAAAAAASTGSLADSPPEGTMDADANAARDAVWSVFN